MADKSALDTVEQGVVIVGGIALLFVGYKVYKGLSSLGPKLPKVTEIGPVISSREYTGPSGQKCREDIGPLGVKTECGPPPEPADVKTSDRSSRIKYWIDHATDPAALLAALKSDGADEPGLERQVFIMAANHEASVGHLVAKGERSWNDEDGIYRDIMSWWANRRGDDRARKAASGKNWRGLVGVAADLCDTDPSIAYGEALGPKWLPSDCEFLHKYAKG